MLTCWLGGAIASVAAMSNIPTVQNGDKFSMGVGVGKYMDYNAVAIGATYKVKENVMLKGSISSNTSGNKKTTAGIGLSWGW